MNNSCCCMYNDCQAYWHGAEPRMVTARQPHKCGECGAQINIGDKFELLSGPHFDGESYKIKSFKTCWFCSAIYRDFFDVDCGRLMGELWDYMEDCFQITLDEALGRPPAPGGVV